MASFNENEIQFNLCEKPSAKAYNITLGLFMSGTNETYKGSVYVDDVALVVDDTVVSTVDYENGSSLMLR